MENDTDNQLFFSVNFYSVGLKRLRACDKRNKSVLSCTVYGGTLRNKTIWEFMESPSCHPKTGPITESPALSNAYERMRSLVSSTLASFNNTCTKLAGCASCDSFPFWSCHSSSLGQLEALHGDNIGYHYHYIHLWSVPFYRDITKAMIACDMLTPDQRLNLPVREEGRVQHSQLWSSTDRCLFLITESINLTVLDHLQCLPLIGSQEITISLHPCECCEFYGGKFVLNRIKSSVLSISYCPGNSPRCFAKANAIPCVRRL